MSAILLIVPRALAEAQIQERIDEGTAFLISPVNSPQDLDELRRRQRRWHDYNTQLLETLFSESDEAQKYARTGPQVVAVSTTLGQAIVDFHHDVQLRVNRLRSLQERLGLFQEDQTVPVARSLEEGEDGNRGDAVFIVHGHAGREYEVEKCVRDLGLEPVILKEEPHGGIVALIQKLQDYARRCGYAVVIYTADDEGRARFSKGDPEPRARENVVFEFGYFLGDLGPERVTILQDPEVQIPSDFQGVGHYVLDVNGGWKAKLEMELRRAGLPVVSP